MTPADALRALRRASGLSQRRLGRACGWDQSAISALETGRVRFTPPVVAVLTRALADRELILRRTVNGEDVAPTERIAA